MTEDITPYYGVTISHGTRIKGSKWKAQAQVFRRDTLADVGEALIGEGPSMTSADNQAMAKAKVFLRGLPEVPEGWKGLDRGASL